MITNHYRRLTLLALVISATILGCKPTPPAPSANPPAPPAKPERTPVTAPPATKMHLYSAEANPSSDIAAALKQARREHKNVILDFGGDWCGDCQVLDIYLHQQPNLALLQKNYLVVHIDIGHMDRNVAIAERYGIPLEKGVPALAVLNATGKILYSQSASEFSDMRYMQSSSVTDFLTRWKA